MTLTSPICFQTALYPHHPWCVFLYTTEFDKSKFFLYLIFPWLTLINRQSFSEGMILKKATELEMGFTLVDVNFFISSILSDTSLEKHFAWAVVSSLL